MAECALSPIQLTAYCCSTTQDQATACTDWTEASMRLPAVDTAEGLLTLSAKEKGCMHMQKPTLLGAHILPTESKTSVSSAW